MTVVGSNNERCKFGTVDSAVEYMKHRANENFVIYDAPQNIINEIREKLGGSGITISKG